MAYTRQPEQTRHERFTEYAAALRERLASGVLFARQPLYVPGIISYRSYFVSKKHLHGFPVALEVADW